MAVAGPFRQLALLGLLFLQLFITSSPESSSAVAQAQTNRTAASAVDAPPTVVVPNPTGGNTVAVTPSIPQPLQPPQPPAASIPLGATQTGPTPPAAPAATTAPNQTPSGIPSPSVEEPRTPASNSSSTTTGRRTTPSPTPGVANAAAGPETQLGTSPTMIGLICAGGAVVFVVGTFVWYKVRQSRRNWWDDDDTVVTFPGQGGPDPFRAAVDKYHQAK